MLRPRELRSASSQASRVAGREGTCEELWRRAINRSQAQCNRLPIPFISSCRTDCLTYHENMYPEMHWFGCIIRSPIKISAPEKSIHKAIGKSIRNCCWYVRIFHLFVITHQLFLIMFFSSFYPICNHSFSLSFVCCKHTVLIA